MRKAILSVLLSINTLLPSAQAADNQPSIKFDDKGVSEINWNGRNYAVPGAFGLKHLNTALDGEKPTNTLGGASALSVDEATNTATVEYKGAILKCRYQMENNRLDMFVEITNKTDKPIVGFGSELVRLNLLPSRVNTASDLVGVSRAIDNRSRKGVRRLEAEGASIGLINWEFSPQASLNAGSQSPSGPYIVGFDIVGKKSGQHPIVDNRFFSQPGRSIAPHTTDKFHFSLLFADSSVTDAFLAAEMNAEIAKQYPMVLDWKDRRPIGTIFLANPHTGWATNPRGYLPGKGKNNDVTTEQGIQEFGTALMQYADKSVEILKEANAQGVIVWDLEGAEHYHPITYIAQPDKLKQIAPEMDRFADEFFKKFRDAGLRTGITIRPTEVVPDPKRPGKWTHIEVKDPVKLMDDKITYAKKRWGCTIFYLDSNVFANDWLTPEQKKEMKVEWVIPTSMLADLMEKHPDVLIIPEWVNLSDYRYAAPYSSVNLGSSITAPSIRAIYPKAFKVMSVSTRSLEEYWDTYVQGSLGGDVFLFNAWYKSAEYGLIRLVLAEAELLKQGPPSNLAKASDEELAKSLGASQGNLRLQYFALEELAKRGNPGSALIVAPFLDSPELIIRKKAVITLGKLKNSGTPELAEAMVKIIRDPKSAVLAPAAADTLGSFGAVSQDLILSLLAEPKRNDLVSRGIRAVRSLQEVSPEIAARLVDLLDAPDQSLQENAIAIVGDKKVQAAVPKLIDLLANKQEVISNMAVVALGKIGDPAAIPPILDLYKRQFASMAVYSIRGNQDDALQALSGDKRSRTRDEWQAYFAKQNP
jgi:HEAT repeat protein